MKTIEKHYEKFTQTLSLIQQESDLNKIRFYIHDIMLYLEKNYLLDKNYLDKSRIFLKAEKDTNLIYIYDIDTLLSFLTMIYRIDYVDANSDGYIIYYKNGMITTILSQIVYLLKDLI